MRCHGSRAARTGQFGVDVAIHAEDFQIGPSSSRKAQQHRPIHGLQIHRSARHQFPQFEADVSVGRLLTEAPGTIRHFDVAIHRAQLPTAFHAANDHAAVHRSDAAEQDAIRNVNVIFDRNFRAFTFGITGMHCNLSGSAVVHFNFHLLDVTRFTRAGLHRADFHLVAVPAVNVHRAIHVFEHETAALGQRVDVMEGFVVGKAAAAHAGQCRQQQQSTQRSKQYG